MITLLMSLTRVLLPSIMSLACVCVHVIQVCAQVCVCGGRSVAYRPLSGLSVSHRNPPVSAPKH